MFGSRGKCLIALLFVQSATYTLMIVTPYCIAIMQEYENTCFWIKNPILGNPRQSWAILGNSGQWHALYVKTVSWQLAKARPSFCQTVHTLLQDDSGGDSLECNSFVWFSSRGTTGSLPSLDNDHVYIEGRIQSLCRRLPQAMLTHDTSVLDECAWHNSCCATWYLNVMCSVQKYDVQMCKYRTQLDIVCKAARHDFTTAFLSLSWQTDICKI